MTIEMQKIDLNTNATANYIADVQKERDEAHHVYSLLHEGYMTDWQLVKTFKHKDFVKRHYYECTEIAFQQATVNPDTDNWIECIEEEITKAKAEPLFKDYQLVNGNNIQVQKFGWL